jgi:hypothetical protein
MIDLPITDLGKINDCLGVGLIVSESEIVFSNEAAKNIFGFDPVGHKISELFGNDFVLPSGSNSGNSELKFEQLIGEEWRIISAVKISDYTVVVIKTDRETDAIQKELQKNSAEIISSARSSVSVINLLADRIAKNSPENSKLIAQIRHNCCKLLKDIGLMQTLCSNIPESPVNSQICISALLSKIISSASPLLAEIGISLKYEKPAFSCVVAIFEEDAERLLYGLLNAFAYLLISEGNKKNTGTIRIYFKKSGDDAYLHLFSDCSSPSSEHIAISSSKIDKISSTMSFGFKKSIDVIRHIVKKYGLNLVYSSEDGGRRSIITKFVLADTANQSVLSQCSEKPQKLTLWSSLIEFSDLLPHSLYEKLI